MRVKATGAPSYIAVGEDWRPIASADARVVKAKVSERAFKLRRASKPRPGDVFLVLGDLEGEGDVRFEDLAEVTWAAAPVFDADLVYRPVRWRR